MNYPDHSNPTPPERPWQLPTPRLFLSREQERTWLDQAWENRTGPLWAGISLLADVARDRGDREREFEFLGQVRDLLEAENPLVKQAQTRRAAMTNGSVGVRKPGPA